MWATRPKDDRPQIDKIGSDEEVFNDCIGSDERDEQCHDDCHDCAEPHCDSREPVAYPIPSQDNPSAVSSAVPKLPAGTLLETSVPLKAKEVWSGSGAAQEPHSSQKMA